MKKGILIDATGNSGWIGGLYYKRNVLFMLLSNPNISENYRITVVTEKENISLFDTFKDRFTLKTITHTRNIERVIKLIAEAKKTKCSYIFDYPFRKFSYIFLFGLFRICPIGWIPDFQHNYLASLFDETELQVRTQLFSGFANSNYNLILSSHSALEDFNRFYHPTNPHIYTLHFVSYIEPIIRSLTAEQEKNILKKYHIDNSRYVSIMNQFWQHKNHITVLEAIREYFSSHTDSDIKFVFTGKLEDNRAPEYIEKLLVLFEIPEIKAHTVLLGFIDREEQIAIMKNAEYIIQPSLFEGWGTVVEDAKVLDKTILLSDIPVHREQRNSKCVLFDPHDPVALAKLIDEENKNTHIDNIDAGIADMHYRAAEYSKAFEQLLQDQERN